jgi:hypothetical protein
MNDEQQFPPFFSDVSSHCDEEQKEKCLLICVPLRWPSDLLLNCMTVSLHHEHARAIQLFTRFTPINK